MGKTTLPARNVRKAGEVIAYKTVFFYFFPPPPTCFTGRGC